MPQFTNVALRDAGVLEFPADGPRLAPELANPAGARIALRRAPGEPPYALLTTRGAVPHTTHSVWLALADAWTARTAADLGFLVAAPRCLARPTLICGIDSTQFEWT